MQFFGEGSLYSTCCFFVSIFWLAISLCVCSWSTAHRHAEQITLFPLYFTEGQRRRWQHEQGWNVISATAWFWTISMTVSGGLRSCTHTTFSPHIFSNSTLMPPNTSGSRSDVMFVTFLLIGSYSFCIVPLLAVFIARPKYQHFKSKSVFYFLNVFSDPLVVWIVKFTC